MGGVKEVIFVNYTESKEVQGEVPKGTCQAHYFLPIIRGAEKD